MAPLKKLSNKISSEALNPGDHIYSWRHAHAYAHHGIYVGNDMVVHFNSESVVISSCLKSFLAGGKLYLYRYGVSKTVYLSQVRGGTCSRAVSDSPEKVIHRANYLLENNGFGPYNLCNNNCEDFALYCKTELVVTTKNNENTASAGTSNQVSHTKAVGIGLLTSVAFPLVLAAANVSSLRADIGQRTDVARVPVESLPGVKDNKNKKDKLGVVAHILKS